MAKNKRTKRKNRISTLTKDGRDLFIMNMKIRQAIPDAKERRAYITALLNDFPEK